MQITPQEIKSLKPIKPAGINVKYRNWKIKQLQRIHTIDYNSAKILYKRSEYSYQSAGNEEKQLFNQFYNHLLTDYEERLESWDRRFNKSNIDQHYPEQLNLMDQFKNNNPLWIQNLQYTQNQNVNLSHHKTKSI